MVEVSVGSFWGNKSIPKLIVAMNVQLYQCTKSHWTVYFKWISYMMHDLEEEMATHSSILVETIPWTKEYGSLQSVELQSVRHDWATEHVIHELTSLYWVGWTVCTFWGIGLFHLRCRIYGSRVVHNVTQSPLYVCRVKIVPISLLILAFCVISPSLWQFMSSFFFLLFLAKFYEFYWSLQRIWFLFH